MKCQECLSQSDCGVCAECLTDLRASLAAITAERDDLRIKQEEHDAHLAHAADEYAALEAERDALVTQKEIAVRTLKQYEAGAISPEWARRALIALAAIAAVKPT